MSESYARRSARLRQKLAHCPTFAVKDRRAWDAFSRRANSQLQLVIVFTTIWGRLMQHELPRNNDLQELTRLRIEELRDETNIEQLSDEQLLNAAYLLAEHWVHGDHLRSTLNLA